MKPLFLVFTVLGLSLSAFAKPVSFKKYTVEIEIEAVTLELQAKCQAPLNEDDSFKPRFSATSYNIIKPYLRAGFSQKLLDKTCGENSTGPELSSDQYETVTVYLVNGQSPFEKLSTEIEKIWNQEK